MLISAYDIKQLNSEDFNLFNFGYLFNNKFSKELHNRLIEYIKSQKFESIEVLYNIDNSFSSYEVSKKIVNEREFLNMLNKEEIHIVFSPQDKIKHTNNFLKKLIGEDLSLIEDFFINYDFYDKKSLQYFQKKDILALDSYTKSFVISCNSKKIFFDDTNTYANLNILYQHNEKIFKKLNSENIFRKYVKEIKKEYKEARENQDLHSSLDHNCRETLTLLKTLISFKRPINEFEELLVSDYISLRDTDFNKLVKKLDKNLMPDIIEKINEHIKKASVLGDIDIEMPAHAESYQIYNTNIKDLYTKYQLTHSEVVNKLNEIYKIVSSVFNLQFNTIKIHNQEPVSSCLLIGKSSNIESAHECLVLILNNKKLFLESERKDILDFCKTYEEKKQINKVLTKPLFIKKVNQKL